MTDTADNGAFALINIYQFQFALLATCEKISLAVKFHVDHQKITSPGKTTETSTFVTVEYTWEDESPDAAPKTEQAYSSFEYYAPS